MFVKREQCASQGPLGTAVPQGKHEGDLESALLAKKAQNFKTFGRNTLRGGLPSPVQCTRSSSVLRQSPPQAAWAVGSSVTYSSSRRKN